MGHGLRHQQSTSAQSTKIGLQHPMHHQHMYWNDTNTTALEGLVSAGTRQATPTPTPNCVDNPHLAGAGGAAIDQQDCGELCRGCAFHVTEDEGGQLPCHPLRIHDLHTPCTARQGDIVVIFRMESWVVTYFFLRPAVPCGCCFGSNSKLAALAAST